MPHIPAAEFVRIWNRSNRVAEVARQTGYSPKSVQCKAYRLRRAGYHLKPYPVGGWGTCRFPWDRAAFVAAWNAAPDVETVSRLLGLSVSAARLRAHYARREGYELKGMKEPETPAAHYARFVLRCRPGCWGWTGKTDRHGAARMHVTIGGRERNLSARKVSWELHHGRKVPAGRVVAATCGNPACTNPDHLEIARHSAASRRVNAELRAQGANVGPARVCPLACGRCAGSFLGEIRQKRRAGRGKAVLCPVCVAGRQKVAA